MEVKEMLKSRSWPLIIKNTQYLVHCVAQSKQKIENENEVVSVAYNNSLYRLKVY